jgi:hypothetical protein
VKLGGSPRSRRWDVGGAHDDPWVLRSSLQCGDQCKEVTDVLRGIV